MDHWDLYIEFTAAWYDTDDIGCLWLAEKHILLYLKGLES